MDFAEKFLELLLEIVPSAKRIGFLIDSGSSISVPILKVSRTLLEKRRIQGYFSNVAKPSEIEAALAQLAKDGIQGLVLLPARFFVEERAHIVKFAMANRWPLSCGPHEFTEAGALLSYGPDRAALYKRSAYFVDRILKGSKPADLPIEQPTKLFGDQSENRQGAGTDDPAVDTGARKQGDRVNRRETLIALLALGAACMPYVTHAQQPDKPRRIGVLMGYAEADVEAQARVEGFKKRLAALGWVEGRNLIIDVRWGAGDVARATTLAQELVAQKCELILSSTTPVTAALQKATQTIPIVFTVVADPLGSSFVKSLARPGGNLTGFVNIEGTLIEKQLEALKAIAPRVKRVGVMFNPDTTPYADYFLRPLNAVAARTGVKISNLTVRSPADIATAIAGLARAGDSGLIVMTDSFMVVHRTAVIEQTARHKVPAAYFATFQVADGGLIAYGVDVVDLLVRAAGYVDRILRGMKASELPVELPSKFELSVNMKTAKALGLTIPQSILVRADKVTE